MGWIKTLESELTEKVGADPPGFVPGQIIHLAPLNQRTSIDIYGPLGKVNSILFGLMFQLGKWGFKVQKISEYTEISPVHAQYYQITIQQKQTLEAQIKAGLKSIADAIADYELVFHDLRKYQEYMKIFEEMERAKKEKNAEKVKSLDSTLRSIFIDQVDIHTGEGVSLRSIVPRWPTIIIDFLKLEDEDIEPEKVAKKYKFSKAEAVVLTTKNKLYLEWRKMFKENVVERYEKLKQLSAARKSSIEEYRRMLKPYIMRYRSIREMAETSSGRKALIKISWFRPGTQAVSVEEAEYWAWKPYWPAEIHKAPEVAAEAGGKIDILKSKLPEELKNIIKENWDVIKESGFSKISVSPTGIEPLDKWVLYFIPKLEDYYSKLSGKKLNLSLTEILSVREEFLKDYSLRGWVQSPYFMTCELSTFRVVLRYPGGEEYEDINFNVSAYLDTQNTMLLRYLELKMIEKEAEAYISDLLGETQEGRKLEEIIKEEFPLLKNGVKKEKPFREKVLNIRLIKDINKIFRIVKPFPYEVNFIDRITGFYFKDLASNLYVPVVNYIKGAAGAR